MLDKIADKFGITSDQAVLSVWRIRNEKCGLHMLDGIEAESGSVKFFYNPYTPFENVLSDLGVGMVQIGAHQIVIAK